MKIPRSNRVSSMFASMALCLCSLSASATVSADEQDLDLSEIKSITVGDETRHFRIHVPYNIDASTPVPLLIDVHPLFGNANGQANKTRWDLVAQKQEATADRFVSVYPSGTGWYGSQVFYAWYKSWNAGLGFSDDQNTYNGCCGQAPSFDAKDVAFMQELVNYMTNQANHTTYKIDPSRIYGSGYSNGSALIQRAIHDKPNLFTAAFVTSQFLVQQLDAPPPSIAVPILLTHGSEDETAPYDGGPNSTGQQFPAAEDNFRTWASLNGCDITVNPSAISIGAGTICMSYDESEDYGSCNKGEIKVCKIVNYAHDIYGYENVISPTEKESLVEIGWNFMKGYTK